MKSSIKTMLFALGLIIFGSLSTQAAAYIKFDGVDGESQDKRHKGWCDIESWSWGVSQPSDRASGRATGKRQHKPFTIIKEIDKSTPLLMTNCVTNKKIGTIQFEVMKPGATGEETTYFKIKLEDCIVTSINHVDDDSDDDRRPLETITINYSKMTWTYEEQGTEFVDDWKNN